jgi:hypothetical protein
LETSSQAVALGILIEVGKGNVWLAALLPSPETKAQLFLIKEIHGQAHLREAWWARNGAFLASY